MIPPHSAVDFQLVLKITFGPEWPSKIQFSLQDVPVRSHTPLKVLCNSNHIKNRQESYWITDFETLWTWKFSWGRWRGMRGFRAMADCDRNRDNEHTLPHPAKKWKVSILRKFKVCIPCWAFDPLKEKSVQTPLLKSYAKSLIFREIVVISYIEFTCPLTKSSHVTPSTPCHVRLMC